MNWILLVPFLLTAGAAAARRPDCAALHEIVQYKDADVAPQFEGGDLLAFREWACRDFTARCLRYDPSQADIRFSTPWGVRVVLGFYVDKQGAVGSVRVLQSPDRFFSKYAVATAEASPRWTPGRQFVRRGDGTSEACPVTVNVVCPFDFWPRREIVDSLSDAGIARTARFTGGAGLTFAEWAAAQVPDAARQDDVACMTDTVYVRFRVGVTGTVREAKAVRSKYPGTARCAERIVLSSPRWLPEVIDRKAVEAEHSVTVRFPGEELSFAEYERMASFRGGDLQSFRKWVETETAKRMAGTDAGNPGGRAVLTFVIDEKGNLADVEVLREGDPRWTKTAADVVRSSPRWAPGSEFTRPEMPCNCRVVWKPRKLRYTMPVCFPGGIK